MTLDFRKCTVKYLEPKGHHVCNLTSLENNFVCVCVCVCVARQREKKGRRERQREGKCNKMLTFGESGRRVSRNSVYYSCSFSVSLKLCENLKKVFL